MAFRETAFRPARIIVSGMILLALAGCSRKSGDAVVLEKERIAAAEIRETPSAAPVNSIPSPTLAPLSAANDEAETARELKPSEIVVDGYVMEKDFAARARIRAR